MKQLGSPGYQVGAGQLGTAQIGAPVVGVRPAIEMADIMNMMMMLMIMLIMVSVIKGIIPPK